jgi:hypothetical protein
MSDHSINHYTQAEAQQLVGQTFESVIEFSRVPKGTRGKVVAIDYMGDGYDLVVEWELGPSAARPNGQGLRDWFTRYDDGTTITRRTLRVQRAKDVPSERFMQPVSAATVQN